MSFSPFPSPFSIASPVKQSINPSSLNTIPSCAKDTESILHNISFYQKDGYKLVCKIIPVIIAAFTAGSQCAKEVQLPLILSMDIYGISDKILVWIMKRGAML